jgi:hypothetical protein
VGHNSHNTAHSYTGVYNGRGRRTNSKLRATGKIISLSKLEAILKKERQAHGK